MADNKSHSFTVPVQANDLIDLRKYPKAREILESKDSKVDFVIQGEMPSLDNARTIQLESPRVIKSLLNRLRSQIDKHIDAAIPKILEQYERDQKEESDAYSQAKTLLDKLNSNLEEIFDKRIGKEAKKAVADANKLSAKELKSIGRINFKKFAFVGGVFEGETSYESGAQDISDLLSKHREKWLFFALLATGTDGRVAVSKSGPVTKVDISCLKESEEVAGNASLYQGILRPDKGKNIKFQFMKGKVPPDNTLKKAAKASAKKFGVKNCSSLSNQLSKLPSAAVLKKTGEKGIDEKGGGTKEQEKAKK